MEPAIMVFIILPFENNCGYSEFSNKEANEGLDDGDGIVIVLI
jgi:hypothetical protein